MEILPQKSENQKDFYDSLKEKVLKGSISVEELRDELLKKEQSDPDRRAAYNNLVFLKSQEVINYIGDDPEIVKGYCGLLSITEFHIAQGLGGDKGSIDYFNESLSHARQGGLGEDWIAYIEGTISYLKGVIIPEITIEKASSPDNNNGLILRKLNEGLKERGKPSYMEDYSKKL